MSMRLLLKLLIVLVLILIAYSVYSYLAPLDLGERTVSVIIQPGDGFSKIADTLVAQGVVRSRMFLRIPARWRDLDKKLIPGRYDFTGKNSCRSVLAKLEAGDFLRLRVTVYEGAPIWMVASILAERMEVDSATVMALNRDSAFCAKLDVPYLEGHLFPETYFFPWGTPLEAILTAMVAMYHRQTEGVWLDDIPNGLNRAEALVLASIVEAEALLDEEKPRIASVYHNRLKRNMRLDADPTVIYGLGGLDRPLWRKDLRKDTPYNTYRRKGLPPTPINSPGLAAIRAVLSPETTDFLYFVADGTGGHRFSRTNAEHNRARQEIKRQQAADK